jgi:hypothetical protein
MPRQIDCPAFPARYAECGHDGHTTSLRWRNMGIDPGVAYVIAFVVILAAGIGAYVLMRRKDVG